MDYDVIVVGGGNAAFAAAVSAKENGAKRVLVLEKAPKEQRGGNTHFSGAIFRFVFNHVSELDRFVPDAEEEFPGFPQGRAALSAGGVPRRPDARDARAAPIPNCRTFSSTNSYDTMCWMQDAGRHAVRTRALGDGHQVGDKVKWPRGAIVRTVHEGVGLSKTWFETARENGHRNPLRHRRARWRRPTSGRVSGVVVRGARRACRTLTAKAVILGCGGFETNPEWRRRYLGDPWDHAKVRGSNFNYGDGLRMALDIGAMPWGHWGGCHATPINRRQRRTTARSDLTDKTNRLSYLATA